MGSVTDEGFDFERARKMRDIGIARVAASNLPFIDKAREIAALCAATHPNGTVCADDVRRIAQRIGLAPTHPNAWGALFKHPRFVMVGYRQSAKISRKAGTQRIWRLKG